jgi:hypothetical protein
VSARLIVASVLALFTAYVVGRAVGIMLGTGPYATEAIAIAVVLGAIVWVAARRRRGGRAG